MSLPGHNGQVDCVKFTSGDDLVYSSDENGIIKRWDLNTQPGCVTFYGHMKSVRTLDFHPHGNFIFASGSNDTTVRLWDVRKSDSCFSKYRGHIANVNSVKFSPDGWWIASAGTEGLFFFFPPLILKLRSCNKNLIFFSQVQLSFGMYEQQTKSWNFRKPRRQSLVLHFIHLTSFWRLVEMMEPLICMI